MLSQPQQPGVHGSEGQQTAAEFLRQTDAPGEARPQVVQLHVLLVFVGFVFICLLVFGGFLEVEFPFYGLYGLKIWVNILGKSNNSATMF